MKTGWRSLPSICTANLASFVLAATIFPTPSWAIDVPSVPEYPTSDQECQAFHQAWANARDQLAQQAQQSANQWNTCIQNGGKTQQCQHYNAQSERLYDAAHSVFLKGGAADLLCKRRLLAFRQQQQDAARAEQGAAQAQQAAQQHLQAMQAVVAAAAARARQAEVAHRQIANSASVARQAQSARLNAAGAGIFGAFMGIISSSSSSDADAGSSSDDSSAALAAAQNDVEQAQAEVRRAQEALQRAQAPAGHPVGSQGTPQVNSASNDGGAQASQFQAQRAAQIEHLASAATLSEANALPGSALNSLSGGVAKDLVRLSENPFTIDKAGDKITERLVETPGSAVLVTGVAAATGLGNPFNSAPMQDRIEGGSGKILSLANPQNPFAAVVASNSLKATNTLERQVVGQMNQFDQALLQFNDNPWSSASATQPTGSPARTTNVSSPFSSSSKSDPASNGSSAILISTPQQSSQYVNPQDNIVYSIPMGSTLYRDPTTNQLAIISLSDLTNAMATGDRAYGATIVCSANGKGLVLPECERRRRAGN